MSTTAHRPLLRQRAALLIWTALLLAAPLPAWAQQPAPAAAGGAAPTPANELKARAPAQGVVVDEEAEEGSTDNIAAITQDVKKALGQAEELWRQVLEQHAALARQTSEPVAWLIFCSPLLLLLLFLGYHRRRARAADEERKGRPRKSQGSTAKGRTRKGVCGKAPPKKFKTVEIAPVTLSLPEQLLSKPDEAWPSIHEAFVVLGADEHALRALRPALATGLDASTWAAALNDQLVRRLRSLRSQWVRAVAVQRIKRWLTEHPLVTTSGLEVYVPSALEQSELDALALTFSSGIRASVPEEQERLILQARSSLEQIYTHSDNPYILFRAQQDAPVPASLAPLSGDGVAGAANQLALLLYGLGALDHMAQVLPVNAAAYLGFRKAIEEHNSIVDTPVPGEGCGVHLIAEIGRPPLGGIGTVLAAVVGAAYSLNTVLQKINKLSFDTFSEDQRALCIRLGQMLEGAVESRRTGNGAHMVTNLKRMLGIELLQAESKRCGELVKATERAAARAPTWEGAAADDSLDVLLVRLHRARVTHLLEHAELAHQRLLEVLETLKHSTTETGGPRGAQQRLGYFFSALGPAAMRAMSTDILSVAREVEIVVRAVTRS